MGERLSDEEVIRNRETVMRLVGKMPPGRSEAVAGMLAGPVGEEYFTAPASSREKFHNCFPGGLAAHSLNVVKNLKKLSDTLCPGRYENHVISFVGLFHDLGKVGDGKEPFYVPNPSEWHRTKLGALYEINEGCLYMPTSERGLFLLQSHGVTVSFEESQAIRLNDGQYVEENRPYRMHECPLALLTHWADRWAVEQENSTV